MFIEYNLQKIEMFVKLIQFFRSRLNTHQTSLRSIIINDMLIMGTAINLTASSLALTVMIQTDNAILTTLIHTLPLPYNIFLVIAVSRRECEHKSLLISIAALWFMLMIIF